MGLVFNIISILVALGAIFLGAAYSESTGNGFYQWLTVEVPVTLNGLTPITTPKWQYTFEELYANCHAIEGQNALITGGNSGVGYETAKALARCGVHVTIACRNPTKCANAAKVIEHEVETDITVNTMTVDTSSLKSVKTFAHEYLEKYGDVALDMLYLNAGIGSGAHLSDEPGIPKLSEDGIEIVFATNYVGHHLLYKLIEPLVLKSKMARVVVTSSVASFNTFKHIMATSLEELNNRDLSPKGMKHYGQSKLAQIMWAKMLTRKYGSKSSVYINAAHPGAVNTLIWDKVGNPDFAMILVNFLRRKLMWTSEEGALTQIFLGAAVDKLAKDDVRGKYFHPQAQEVTNPLANDEILQEKLWAFSDELVADFL